MSRLSPLLRPKMIGAHVLVVVLVFTMLNLSAWQFRRLDQRKAFNAEVRERGTADPVPLATLLDAKPDDTEWRHVVVNGVFRPGTSVTVTNRSQDSTAGVDALQALDFTVGTTKYVLVVNRGFVPLATTAPTAPTGSVEFLGRVRKSQERRIGGLTDAATGTLTEIQRVDVPRLSKQMKTSADQTVLPFYVDLLEYAKSANVTSNLPARVADPELSNGPHLSYAIQWIFFSGCALAAWVMLVRRALRSQPSA